MTQEKAFWGASRPGSSSCTPTLARRCSAGSHTLTLPLTPSALRARGSAMRSCALLVDAVAVGDSDRRNVPEVRSSCGLRSHPSAHASASATAVACAARAFEHLPFDFARIRTGLSLNRWSALQLAVPRCVPLDGIRHSISLSAISLTLPLSYRCGCNRGSTHTRPCSYSENPSHVGLRRPVYSSSYRVLRRAPTLARYLSAVPIGASHRIPELGLERLRAFFPRLCLDWHSVGEFGRALLLGA